jgi:hypothetical protein
MRPRARYDSAASGNSLSALIPNNNGAAPPDLAIL